MSVDNGASDPSTSAGGYTTLKLRAPLLMGYTTATSTNVYTTYNYFSLLFNYNDFTPGSGGVFGASTPIQGKHLAWYFNLWQEFRLKNVKWSYVPRWNLGATPIPAIAQNTGDQNQDGYFGYEYNQPDPQGNSGSFQNELQITILGDRTDISQPNQTVLGAAYIVGNDALGTDEMFMARGAANAHVFSSRNYASNWIVPHEMGVTLTNNVNAQGNANGIQQGISVNALVQTVNESSPQPNTWKSTRIGLSPNTTTVDQFPNIYQEMLGFKCWIYDPYNRNSAPTNFLIGQLWLEYEFEFRNREYRNILQNYNFWGMNPEYYRRMEEAELKIQGPRPRHVDDLYGKFKRRAILAAAGIPEDHDPKMPPKRQRADEDHQSPQTPTPLPQTPLQTFQARKK